MGQFLGGDSDLTIIFLGETTQSYTPGQFDYFLLTGAVGMLRGFSTELISNAFEEHAIDLDAMFKQGGSSSVEITSRDSPLVEGVELSPKLVRLEPETSLDPYYSRAHQIIYGTKGRGRV
ncbi:cocosin 1-like [Salvia divinorum]|uniref:Cocosin 1-like n=1 Tax=Salvia divinorum TaxID=28513 RepID=A0ABD1GRD9_SALDI